MGQSIRHRGVDGVNAVVWLVAVAQARLGGEPVLVNRQPLTPEARAFAEAHGVRDLVIPTMGEMFYPGAVKAALRRWPPDVVHMHSTFVPHQAVLARELRDRGVPYVVTPHGGVAPLVLRRGRLKKAVYAAVVERGRFQAARAVTAVTMGEAAEVRAFTRTSMGRIPIIPSPVDARLLDPLDLRSESKRPILTFLGRFDVMLKGIDRLFDLARLLPEVDVRLFGTEHPPSRALLAALDRKRPPNLELHAPVYGEAKVAALAVSTMYIQASRSDAFPVSVAEAMSLGVPVAISRGLHLATLVERHAAGVLLDDEPRLAAAQLRGALADRDRLRAWGQNGRAYALGNFDPLKVARSYLCAYDLASPLADLAPGGSM